MAPALAAWTAKLDPAVPANEPALLEALWTYQALDIVEPKLLAELLNAQDYRVRAAAVRVASAWHARLPDPLDVLAPRVGDDEAQVRLEAVRALAQVPSVRSAEMALEALDRPMDKWLDYALWLTMRELEPEWMPALQQGKFNYGGNSRRLLFALEAAGTKDVLGPLVKLVKDGKAPPDQEESVLTLIATLGGPKELALVLDRAIDGKAPARAREPAGGPDRRTPRSAASSRTATAAAFCRSSRATTTRSAPPPRAWPATGAWRTRPNSSASSPTPPARATPCARRPSTAWPH